VTDPEARRARQRAYSAAYRARQRELVEDALAVDPDDVEPGPMLTAVNTSVDAMRWIEDSDYALVVLTRQQAAQIDALHAVGTSAARAQAVRAQGQLLRSLQALGGTPVVRMQHELRSRRLEAVTAKVAGWQGAPVSSIKRPPRRR
jgi:hypothetical protein